MKVNTYTNDKLIKDYTGKRLEHKNFIINKYYNIFLNNYKMPSIDVQQKEFILKMFWTNGTIATFKLEGSEGSSKHPQGVLVFVPYTPSMYNIYDFPIEAIPVNRKGVPFIPTRSMVINEEIVLGWCQRNKRPIRYIVNYYANKIADIEMVLWINLQLQKTPWMIKITPENKVYMSKLMKQIFDDAPALYVPADVSTDVDALLTNAPYILDKLQTLKCEYENELKEMLGLENLGVQEKKEHLIGEEVKSNNQTTQINADCILDNLKEFSDRVKTVLGVDFPIELNRKADTINTKEGKEEQEVEDDE